MASSMVAMDKVILHFGHVLEETDGFQVLCYQVTHAMTRNQCFIWHMRADDVRLSMTRQ